jgi:hypothetical protein
LFRVANAVLQHTQLTRLFDARLGCYDKSLFRARRAYRVGLLFFFFFARIVDVCNLCFFFFFVEVSACQRTSKHAKLSIDIDTRARRSLAIIRHQLNISFIVNNNNNNNNLHFIFELRLLRSVVAARATSAAWDAAKSRATTVDIRWQTKSRRFSM